MREKLGLTTQLESDKELIEELLNIMAANKADFTLTFYHLSRISTDLSKHEEALHDLFGGSEQIKQWLGKWRPRVSEESLSDEARQSIMQAVNPVYIPRNHQVEAAIRAAEDASDFSVFNELHDVLQHPYKQQTGKEKYMFPPKPDEVVEQTFCGT